MVLLPRMDSCLSICLYSFRLGEEEYIVTPRSLCGGGSCRIGHILCDVAFTQISLLPTTNIPTLVFRRNAFDTPTVKAKVIATVLTANIMILLSR